MKGKETREPTIGEVMKEIRKCRKEVEKLKDEVVKNFQASRIGIWMTPFAFGLSIGIFGLASLERVGGFSSGWSVWWPAGVIWVMGFGAMVLVVYRARRAAKEFREKWHEDPPRL